MRYMNRIALVISVAVLLFCAFSFKAEKKIKVELTLQQWQIIVGQLDQSAAPHTEIKITTGWIVEQVKPQLDTLKK